MNNFALVVALVSCPNKETASRLAKLSVGHRLAACAQIVPGVESWYWWEGEMETSDEFLLLLKTGNAQKDRLETLLRENHPDKVPEILFMKPESVATLYQEWAQREMTP